MGENFMSIITRIKSDIVETRKKMHEKTASLITEAILDRVQNGTISRNTEKEINTAIEDFSEKEQIAILVKVAVLVAMNAKSGRRNTNNDNRYEPRKNIKNRSDLFGRYDD